MGYIFYPAAPPWYYFKYGDNLIIDSIGNPAGLAKFDALLGISMYTDMYAQGTNTFGAMPSMHAAFPLLLVIYSLKFKNKLLTLLFFISMIGIWYGAVYTAHHYLIDIIIGIVCGIIGLFITESLVNRKFMPKWYLKAIAYIG
jgi:membrane-associated phospholipid phosphatase